MAPNRSAAGGTSTPRTASRRPRGTRTLGLPEPVWPVEDDIDAAVREDLDRLAAEGVEFLGDDGPRLFPVTRAEALAALDDFVEHRLPDFGRYEDAIMSDDRWMAHSLLSVPLNLGLLDPIEVARAAETAYHDGAAPLAAVEGFVRQVIGWRDYIWHLYWHLGEDYRTHNQLDQRRSIDDWFAALDPDGTDAACVRSALTSVRETGWTHHIPRLMVLGNYALQHRWKPQQVTDWFHRAFVDGYDWVMVPNVVGMSQHADGGVLATKPYTSGGGVHQHDERPLRRLPLRPEEAGGGGRLPVHRWLLAVPAPPPRAVRVQPADGTDGARAGPTEGPGPGAGRRALSLRC